MIGSENHRQAPGRGARDRILTAARQLFFARGIQATGIAELCAAAQVSRRTLYKHFSSKDELVAEYLTAIAGDPAFAPEAVLARTDLAPRARLIELFAALAEGPRPLRGDPFVNAAIEASDPADTAHRVAAEHKRGFVERLANLARAAGARDPERVGRRLALLYDGAAAQVAISDSPEPAAEAQAMAAALLREALD
ncbi:MAG: TetR/AcrR family transcriptional regulator [Solirubrobacteraceae bacterium]